MIRRILVPLDGSSFDEAVLPHARRIGGPGGELHLLHVLPAFLLPVGGVPPRMLSLPEEALQYLERRRRDIPGVPGTEIVRSGDAADRILQVSMELNIDIIAMGTHARRPVARWLLGSVAERIVLHSSLPVLLVPPDGGGPREVLRRILVPIGGPEASRSILDVVRPMAAEARAEIVLLRVVSDAPDPNFAYDPHYPSMASGVPGEQIGRIADGLEREGIACRTVVVRGHEAGEIVAQTRALDADFAAMATVDYGGLQGALAGSVAEGVLHGIDRPLMLRKVSVRSKLRPAEKAP